MTENLKTKSQRAIGDVIAYTRAKNTVLWIATKEESRVENALVKAAKAMNFMPRFWDVARGFTDINGETSTEDVGGRKTPLLDPADPDPGRALDVIRTRAERPCRTEEEAKRCERGLWIMRDLPVWLAGPPGAPVNRRVKNLAKLLPGIPIPAAQQIVILTSSAEIPPELVGCVTLLDWPLPDREEIGKLLDDTIAPYDGKIEPLNGNREAAIDAAVGLSGEDAQSVFSKSIVQLGKIDPAVIAEEKRTIITRDKVLEWFDPLPGGLDAVGGLDIVKGWLTDRADVYTPEARAYGLKPPRGIVVVGVSGCGKTMIGKATSTAYGCPMVRLNFGALKNKWMGSSEQNVRNAFKQIDALGKVVVLVDEIEKDLQGATASAGDGGVAADALGSFLTWMNERKGEAFVIATANNVEALPPEILRKGRFNEVWFVDLPNKIERREVLKASIRSAMPDKDRRAKLKVNINEVTDKNCDGFTGAEIAAIVDDAMFAAFKEKREMATADLIKAAKTVVPLSQTAEKKIKELREWAVGKARPASSPDTTKDDVIAEKRVRVLEV